MAKRLRFSRFRRLPGIYRFGERKPADPGLDAQRITLYLPANLLDRAEAQAKRAGFETVQAYCEKLLEQAIGAEHAREVMEATQAKRGPLEGLDAIANDPTYLVEWNASRERSGPSREERSAMSPLEPEVPEEPPAPIMFVTEETAPAPTEPAADTVLRHAGFRGDDPASFLPTLRRGETVSPEAAQELLQALRMLEVELRSATQLDRRLAYALHRLAFEGQVLLTDAWSAAPVDDSTIDLLRLVQESVDRVLSGEDIRYFAPEVGPERSL